MAYGHPTVDAVMNGTIPLVVFNQSGVIARNTTMNLTSPSDPATITNLPFDAAGNVIPARAKPNGAGFGVATDYQPPRLVQLQVRFSF